MIVVKYPACISPLEQYVDHPKIWKQNPYQDQDSNFLGNDNDAQILHCCKILKNNLGKHTCIFTNDKCLKVKADAIKISIYESKKSKTK